MREIIRNGAVVSDDWVLLRVTSAGDKAPAPGGAGASSDTNPGALPEDPAATKVPLGRVIVPLAVWQAQKTSLATREELGVWLASDERPEILKDVLDKFQVVAVDFPKFTDGRGYSIAYNLRARMGYKGELRAIGDVLRDQLFYMQRVGFDTFVPRADRNIHDALKGLTDFSESYQTSWDQKTPLFKRIARPGARA
ncbi:MAG: DUF934 domain-containing protein [Burkholderiaceae bacterium]